MSRLNATATSLTWTDVNVEAAYDRASWNLNLILLIEMILLHVTTAFLTLLGQRNVDDFVGFLFGQGTTSFEAILLATLAAGFLGILFGRSLGERRRLPLVGTRRPIDKLFELNDPRFELSDLPIFLGDGLKELFVGRLGHPGYSRCPLPYGLPCTNSKQIG